jgi:hypothetical protein
MPLQQHRDSNKVQAAGFQAYSYGNHLLQRTLFDLQMI